MKNNKKQSVKKMICALMIGLTVGLISSCSTKMSFEDQIKQDVYEKISQGYCEEDKIAKDAEIKNLQIGEITPIGNTGMIDVSLEFDVVNPGETEQHIKEAMLYLEEGGEKKMLAIFCEYDYRKKR